MKGFDMLMNYLHLLAVMDNGISVDCLNNYIMDKPELYEGQHKDVEAVLRKVLGNDFDKVISYSRENNVVYSC